MKNRDRIRPALARGVALACFAGATLLAACQTDGTASLSIEEAKQVVADFGGAGFEPPPRTVEDVLAFLKRPNPDADARRAEKLELAESQPRADMGAGDLIDFYKRRAGALNFLGRVAEEMADLDRALALGAERPDLIADVHWALGLAHVHAGNFKLGLEHRRQAIALADPARGGAVISRNSGLAAYQAHIGDFEAARASLKVAQAREGEMASWKRGREFIPVHKTMIRFAEGSLSFGQGNHAEAERSFREALRIISAAIKDGASGSRGNQGWEREDLLWFIQASVQGMVAQALVPQGRLVEAEIYARASVESAVGHYGRLSVISAEVMPTLGLVLLEQGRALDAATISREAVAIYDEMGVSPDNLFYNRARAGLAEALATMGRWSEVADIYRAIERDLAGNPQLFANAFAGSASWAMAEISAGDPAAAAARLEPALARHARTIGDKHLVTAETQGLLAAALTAQGKAGQALPMFEQAFGILSSNSRDSAEEGVTQTARNRRIAFILEGYLEALAAAGPNDPGAADRSLRVAGLAQGRSVQQAVLAASARAAVADPELADLVRREQDARKQVAALNGTLANIMAAPPEQRAAGGEEQIRVQVAELRNARASLAREIETRFPDYAALTNPKPPGVAETQAALAPGEALIATYVGERGSYSWAVPKAGKGVFRAVARKRIEVMGEVARLRRALDPNAATLGDIPDFDVARAHGLYRDFLEPVRSGWDGAGSLMVVADGPLGQLPLGVLVTRPVAQPKDGRLLFDGYRDVPWLARDHAVTVLPSVASLAALRALPPERAGRRPFVGFGDPVFELAAATPVASQAAPAAGAVATRGLPVKLRSAVRMRGVDSAQLGMLPPLPDTAEEIRAIAAATGADPQRDVFLGLAASERQVKSAALADYRVVAFATHGLLPGDLDGLSQPALALSAPQPGDGGDGLLTLEEVLALRLDADWVVLSACNTGTAQGAGAEAVSGLGRAFFYAGSRALLVSNWPVETTSARALTTDVFHRQAEAPGLGRAEALRQSVLGLMDGPGFVDPASKTAVFSYAHPIFWAPFSLVGDGGA